MNTMRSTASAMSAWSACIGAGVASAMSCSRRTSPAAALPACTVARPPGWPVFHDLSRSRAEPSRTSPTMIRVGR